MLSYFKNIYMLSLHNESRENSLYDRNSSNGSECAFDNAV